MSHNFAVPAFITGLPPYPEFHRHELVEAYRPLNQLFESADLDPQNPFAHWIRPGMSVLVKPNWVRHAAEGWSSLECLVTHPSILRPVVEAVARALTRTDGSFEGEIILADAPLQSANFEVLLEQCGIQPMLAYWKSRGIRVRLRDLRRMIADTDDSTGVVRSCRASAGDPTGDTIVDLGSHSRLEDLVRGAATFGVSNYDSRTTSSHHYEGVHRYRIANSLLDSDVVVNLPKWKTHVKTGVTGALKNFIGVNCDKEYLPHFRSGSPKHGGDEYPDSMTGAWIAKVRPILERVVPSDWIRSARKSMLSTRQRSSTPLVFGGAWPGNDTLWRTIFDINAIVRWRGQGGAVLETPRPVLTLMDAVVAGQGDGPLRPTPANMGCLAFGLDIGIMDVTMTALSGLPWRQIPLLAHLVDPSSAEITAMDLATSLPNPIVNLQPPSSWLAYLNAKESGNVAA
jgi:uncharacterized protein (DUF362 family)